MIKIITLNNIEWDTTDGGWGEEPEDDYAGENPEEYEEPDLPASITYRVDDLINSILNPDEDPSSITDDEIEDAAIDHASDEYGFCIFGADIQYGEAEEEDEE